MERALEPLRKMDIIAEGACLRFFRAIVPMGAARSGEREVIHKTSWGACRIRKHFWGALGLVAAQGRLLRVSVLHVVNSRGG